MAQLENLTPGDVTALENFADERKKLNQKLDLKIHEMTDMDIAKKLDRVLEEIASLNAKLDHIFGKAVLLDGRFIELK